MTNSNIASTPRRRVPATVPPPTTPRRRVPAPPTLPPNSKPVSGKVWNARRRSSVAAGPRRRQANYGYAGKQQLQQNYGYTMPQQTNYGYTGAGPKKNSMVPMMLAGAGGLAAGAVLGAGAYYAYSQMSRNNWAGGYNDRSWCTVPSGTYQGRVMTCRDCYDAYGSRCKSENECYNAGGCQYEMTQNMERDDVFAAGFVPGEYTPPLTLTVTGIVGVDFSKTGIGTICPVAPTTLGRLPRPSM